MKSVVAWWTDGRDSPFVRLPVREVVEHAQRRGWLDSGFHYLCLDGDDVGVRAVADYLVGNGIPSHDLRPLRNEIAAAFPRLRVRAGRFFDCFLRWLVIERFCAGESVLSWDADIFLNGPLSGVHRLLSGQTGTAGSTCFAAISDGRWFQVYREHLDAFEKGQVQYLAEMDRDYESLRNQGRLGFADDSPFGHRLAGELNATGSVRGVFDSTPEEIFVDRLVRCGRLPQQWFLRKDGHVVCSQLLTLPGLCWVTGFEGASDVQLAEPLTLEKREEVYHVDGVPLLFVHFQGAVFRLCAAQWIRLATADFAEGRLSPLKSRLHPGDRDGAFAEDVLSQFLVRGRHGSGDANSDAAAIKPTEANVARRFMIDGTLMEVFNDHVSDRSGLWRT